MSDDDTGNQLAQSIVLVDRNSSPFVSLTLFGFFQLLSSDRTSKAFPLEDQSDFYFQFISLSLRAMSDTGGGGLVWRMRSIRWLKVRVVEVLSCILS